MTTDDTAVATDTSAADTLDAAEAPAVSAETQSVDEQIGTSAEAPIDAPAEDSTITNEPAVAVTACATEALATIKASTPEGHEDHGIIAKIEADLAEAEAWIAAWFAAHA